MALQDLLDISNKRKKIGLSEERIENIKPQLRQYIAFWREYPDLFIDFLQDGGDPTKERKLKFYFYQRVFLRAAMRYKYVYMVFPRAYSKSFLSVMVLMCRCVLYPRCKLFVTSGGKEQAAGIIKEKVDEICNLVPAFERELDMRPGKTRQSKDYCIFMFKNGSYFDNIAARESSRGKRRHGGLVEECVGVDGTILSEVIIPTMNVSRLCMDGTMQPDETLNKSQIFVTTALIFSSRVRSSSQLNVKSPFSSSQSLTTSRARASPPLPPSAHTVERTVLTPSSRHLAMMKSISASVSVGKRLTATTQGSL